MGNTQSIYKTPEVKAQLILHAHVSQLKQNPTKILNKRTAAEEKRRLLSTKYDVEALVHINYLHDQMELCERLLYGEYKLVQMIKDIMKTDKSPKYTQLLSERTLLLHSHWKRICEWEEISPVPPEVDLAILECIYDSDVKMTLT